MSILDRLKQWFARQEQVVHDPIMSSPSEEAQLEMTSPEQEGELLDEGETRAD